MIIPLYWAEGRAQDRQKGKQVTVRRFGWSDESQASAQSHADQRAQEALQRQLNGAKLPPRERRVAYNGADGMPIREEILAKHGKAIITRNSYGAHCLNSPDVLFADIDFQQKASFHFALLLTVALLLGATALGVSTGSKILGFGFGFFALFFGGALASWLIRKQQALQGGAEGLALRQIEDFAKHHPDWGLRVYRTPAGLRALATHALFEPSDPQVSACFAAFNTDPIYVRMCLNQQCFRARVSPKPWRMGIKNHMRPRPGLWPVVEDRRAARDVWIHAYESAATAFAACTFLRQIGQTSVHPEVADTIALHDKLCRSESGLPLA
ncbi:MAG: hypothetical protein KBA75_04110 [Alphaproteobacteria bacterium]|nr:hypothetical protein [Alphaproteobacteria bacterium]